MMLGIFTKPTHVEKLHHFLNTLEWDFKYFISTKFEDLNAYNFDVGISYCFPRIIPDCHLKDKKWYNYHPAPLPRYPGLNCYAFAIKDKVKNFGVTLHEMTDKPDAGEILARQDFKLDTEPVHHNELGTIAHYYLFQLFKKTVERIILDEV